MNLIQPTNPVVTPSVSSVTINALWVTSVNIQAQNPSQPVQCVVQVAPYDTGSGIVHRELTQVIRIPDVFAAADETPSVGNAIGAIFQAVQDLVVSQSLFS